MPLPRKELCTTRPDAGGDQPKPVTAQNDTTLAEVVGRISELLQRGAPWEACDLFREHIPHYPNDAMLLYYGALAHARSGAGVQAQGLLDQAQTLARDHPAVLADILSLRGRLWKDRLLSARDSDSAMEMAARARTEYLAAYTLLQQPFAGINAASLSLILGDAGTARRLAGELIARLAQPADSGHAAGFWDLATEAEARLLLGQMSEARQCYSAAAALAGADDGSIATLRRQLKLLARVLPGAADMLEVLPAPTVLACAGNMLDTPDRKTPRFPASLVPAVAAAMRERLKRLHRPIIFTSAACGADLLWIEAALEFGAEVNIVLPFNRDDFVRTSVAAGGEDWIRRFDLALLNATRVIPATQESYLGDDVLFEHAALMLEGLAALRARQLETAPQMLCVMDAEAAGLVGGTRDSFERWSKRFGPPQVIDLRQLRADSGVDSGGTGAVRQTARPPVAAATTGEAAAATSRRTLKTLLFADVAGYSRLRDAHVPLFQERFWQMVSENLAALKVAPLLANSWGDAIYLVFESPDAGADFALALVASMKKIDWSATGLQGHNQIRIALHTGAVFCGYDPIIARDNYFGSNVTRAARIEPITAQGMIYASEDFAATLAATGRQDFLLEYIGEKELAKGYGRSRIYRVDRN